MDDFFKYLFENKDWIFSGVGVVIFTGLYTVLIKKKEKVDTPYIISLPLNENKEEQQDKKESKEEYKIYEVVRRFIKVYEEHGILQSQIPGFVDKKFGLQLKDFKDQESVLQILNDELINWTCKKFGVQRDWIDGTSEYIYNRKNYYKKIHSFIDDLYNLIKNGNDIDIYAFKFGDLVPDDTEDENEQEVVLLMRYSIGQLNSKIVYKYIPISTLWNWGYWRSRYQLKAIFYICEKLNVFLHGYDLREKNNIASGEVFPEKIVRSILNSITWYPEDYIELPSQSIQAKEVEETKKVREYFKQEGYLDYLKKCKETY